LNREGEVTGEDAPHKWKRIKIDAALLRQLMQRTDPAYHIERPIPGYHIDRPIQAYHIDRPIPA
jgi:hypothetical protein